MSFFFQQIAIIFFVDSSLHSLTLASVFDPALDHVFLTFSALPIGERTEIVGIDMRYKTENLCGKLQSF